MDISRSIASIIRIAISLTAGVVCYIFAPLRFFVEVSQEVIAVLGFIMASILPTMILAAMALRSGSISPIEIKKYAAALRTQLAVWAGLFIFSLIPCLIIIFIKGAKDMIPEDNTLGFSRLRSFDAATIFYLLNASATVFICMAIIRIYTVFVGIQSILSLSASMAMKEATSRIKQETNMKIADLPEEGPRRIIDGGSIAEQR